MSFDGDPFTCQCEKEDQKAEGVQFTCYCGNTGVALLWVVLKWLHGSQGDKDGDGRRVGVGGLTMLVSVMGKT